MRETRDGKCIHDGRRKRIHECFNATGRVDNKIASVTDVWCDDCGAFLYTTTSFRDSDTKSCRVAHDDIYELLYTKSGRRGLLKRALGDLGIPIPQHWKNFDND